MKHWSIEIDAQNEQQALDYLKALIAAFELAIKIVQPMELTYFEHPGLGTKLKCKTVKR